MHGKSAKKLPLSKLKKKLTRIHRIFFFLDQEWGLIKNVLIFFSSTGEEGLTLDKAQRTPTSAQVNDPQAQNGL